MRSSDWSSDVGSSDLIGGRAVRTQQDHVVEFAVLHVDAALHLVFYHRLALVGGLEADDEGRIRTGFGRIAVAPAAVISHRLPGGALGVAHLLKLLRGGKAFIGMAAGQKPMGDFGMTGLAGGMIYGLAVPIEDKPTHPVQNGGTV